MKYRRTDVPSLIQNDHEDGEEVCYKCKKRIHCDFHHIMNGSKHLKYISEVNGFWVWLCPECHRWLHGTGHGAQYQRTLKALVQERYEEDHSRAEWFAIAHKNYRKD